MSLVRRAGCTVLLLVLLAAAYIAAHLALIAVCCAIGYGLARGILAARRRPPDPPTDPYQTDRHQGAP